MVRLVRFGVIWGVVLGGCSFAAVPEAGAPLVVADPSVGDATEVRELTGRLEGFRSLAFDRRAMELSAHHNVLYWKTYPGFSPILHRRDEEGAQIDFGFGIGAGDDNNYRASRDVVVTAARDGDKIAYRSFDAHSANKAVGTTKFPTPSNEQKWWAYAVSGMTTFVITTPTEATGKGHVVSSFTPGAEPTRLFTLEDAGVTVGELLDFDVDGTTMMIIESGRLWHVDMALKQARFMGNKTEISGAVSFSADGVVWEDATGLKYFDSAAGAPRDLSQELRTASYRLNETYKTSHYYYSATASENFGRWQDWVLYTANSGIFAYNLKTKAIAPVLLNTDTDEARVAYRYPVALDNGAMFVVGLTSLSGSIGADGPVYQTNLLKVLPR